MSSASKCKKVSSKPSGNANGGNGVPISGYNPILGKFHVVDTSPTSSIPQVRINSRFSSIDVTNDPCWNSIGSGKEDDTVSNNSSWSGDSEDHKEKTTHPTPSPQPDNEKREKIRQKNEKKHQRQKERRAQELHDRCIGFLRSRKLEALIKQLVVMGFSSEGATKALILNQGKIKESILWLIEEGDASDQHKQKNNHLDNLKIDVLEELARIADMENRYKCSKQDVERAIVSCEGDLEKAEENLRASISVQYKEGEKKLNCRKTDITALTTTAELETGFQQDMKKSLPKLDLPPAPQRTSSQPKSEAHYVLLKKEINNQKMVQQPERDNPNWAPRAGNLTSSVVTKQIYSEDQNHRQIGFNTGLGVKKRNSPTISVASSLGLFSGTGSTSGSSGQSSPVDWNSVGPFFMHFDYNNVDWSLNPSPSKLNATTAMWQNDRRNYDPFPSASTARRSSSFREWASPFEERDIFSLPRQFVSPPSL